MADTKPHYSMDLLEYANAQRDEARAEATRLRQFINGQVIPDLYDIANLVEAGQSVGDEVDALVKASRTALELPAAGKED